MIIAISEDADRSRIRTEIKEKLEKDLNDATIVERQPIGKALLGQAPELIVELIASCIPLFGGVAQKAAKSLLDVIRTNPYQKK